MNESKDLLIFYNIYGTDDEIPEETLLNYIKEIDIVLWHLEKNNLTNKVRFVISAVLKSDYIINSLKQKYGDFINIFRYDENFPVQVTSNKTILKSIQYFDEDYLGYFYISAGVKICKDENLFLRIIEKLKTNEFGIINLPVDSDNGPNDTSGTPPFNQDVYFKTNTTNKKGSNWNNMNVTIFHKNIKEFYGVPICDVYGLANCESSFALICSSIRMKYIGLGNCLCEHRPGIDSKRPDINSKGEPVKIFQKSTNETNNFKELLWGREIKDLENIKLTFFEDINNFDENTLSINPGLKNVVKTYYFTNKQELDYDMIDVQII